MGVLGEGGLVWVKNLGLPCLLLVKKPLAKSFDRLRTNGKLLVSFAVGLSNRNRCQLLQGFLNLLPTNTKQIDSTLSRQTIANLIFLPMVSG